LQNEYLKLSFSIPTALPIIIYIFTLSQSGTFLETKWMQPETPSKVLKMVTIAVVRRL
jgi:hypothetical protein